MNDPRIIGLLADIALEGQLGTLRERWSYARREVVEHDHIVLPHARLDAQNIGSVAADLLGFDADEATELALEAITPDRFREAAAELIEEMHTELFGPQPQPETATAATTKKPRKW